METVFIVFGRWTEDAHPHVIGVFKYEEDAKREERLALTQTIPRVEAFTREFGVK